MFPLFPEISSTQEYRLKVDDLHELHIEEYGNPEGVPVLILSDGPKYGQHPAFQRLFDAECFRLIQFDVRGTGRSTPFSEVRQNTAQLQLNDIDKIISLLNISRCVLFGVGVGADLAYRFVSSVRERVEYENTAHSLDLIELLLVNAANYDAFSLNWMLGNGVSHVFPDYWKDFLDALGMQPQGLDSLEPLKLLQIIEEKLSGENELVQMQVARAWSQWVMRIALFHPDKAVVEAVSHTHSALSVAKIETHYLIHNGFHLPSKPLALINNCRCTLIHGRYNMRSPVSVAMAMQSRVEGAELKIVRDAGHSLKSPALIDAVIKETNRIAHGEGLEGA